MEIAMTRAVGVGLILLSAVIAAAQSQSSNAPPQFEVVSGILMRWQQSSHRAMSSSFNRSRTTTMICEA
jgi:hypothetical protein